MYVENTSVHRDYEMIILTDGHLCQLNQLVLLSHSGCSSLERKDPLTMMIIERSALKQVVQHDQRDIFM